MFCKKGVLRNFAKFTAKHLRQSLFFNKVAGLGIPEKWDPGSESGTRDPGPQLGPYGGTLRWDPKVGSYDGTLRWDPTVGPYSETLRWDPSVRRKSSHSQLFFKVVILKHFRNIHKKTSVLESPFNK